jgi:hypothetical protein
MLDRDDHLDGHGQRRRKRQFPRSSTRMRALDGPLGEL